MISKEKKNEIFGSFGLSSKDTGSCEVQVALLSERIRQISEHLKIFSKDLHSQRGLVKLVGKRRVFLNYLKKSNDKTYDNVMQKLRENGYI
jgi:small subunit ribosomal protein S15